MLEWQLSRHLRQKSYSTAKVIENGLLDLDVRTRCSSHKLLAIYDSLVVSLPKYCTFFYVSVRKLRVNLKPATLQKLRRSVLPLQ